MKIETAQDAAIKQIEAAEKVLGQSSGLNQGSQDDLESFKTMGDRTRHEVDATIRALRAKREPEEAKKAQQEGDGRRNTTEKVVGMSDEEFAKLAELRAQKSSAK